LYQIYNVKFNRRKKIRRRSNYFYGGFSAAVNFSVAAAKFGGWGLVPGGLKTKKHQQ